MYKFIFNPELQKSTLVLNDNPHNNCLVVDNFQDFVNGTFANKIYLGFIGFYPNDRILLNALLNLSKRFAAITFFFQSFNEEFELQEHLLITINKTPILLLYKNNEKVFEQVGILLKAEEQLEIILQQHFG